MKVVINKCYGGFGLSEKAVMRYAELKGFKLWVAKDGPFNNYWRVPPKEWPKEINWKTASKDERSAHNEEYKRKNFYERDIPRDDTALVQVVEELGQDASGYGARLKVVEIPDGINWYIDDYDGMENIAEKHRSWG